MKENTILPSFVTTALLSMARSHMAANAPNQVLEEYGEAYMHRWFLEKDRTRGSVYIHHILRCQHHKTLCLKLARLTSNLTKHLVTNGFRGFQ